MTCFYPVTGYWSRDKSKNGKNYFTTSKEHGYVDKPLSVSCGRCIGCRLDRSKSWAVRCIHEAQLHSDSCFITLTYNDANCPGDLVKSDFQKFLKRLRRSVEPLKIRFFMCGEYGDLLKRPHYHAIIFGWYPEDAVLWSVRDGVRLYRSAKLEALWPYGYSTVGDVTFESAAYVARYIMKKIGGDKKLEHYFKSLDTDTGELTLYNQEYTTMSLKPGIAHDWITKFFADVYTRDEIVVRSDLRVRPPKYYDNIYDNIGDLDLVKNNRKLKAKELASDNTYERRETKRIIQQAKLNQLPRKFMEED